MPARAKVRKISSGKKKGKYKVETSGGVKAKGTAKEKAEAQRKILEGVKRGGWRPTGKKKAA